MKSITRFMVVFTLSVALVCVFYGCRKKSQDEAGTDAAQGTAKDAQKTAAQQTDAQKTGKKTVDLLDPEIRARAEKATRDLKPIKKGDDPEEVLGKPLSERDFGLPYPLEDDLLEELEHVYTDPGEIPQLRVKAGKKTLELPLKHTHVNAAVTGYVARVQVTQTYQNPFEYPIEAVYVFPLPENSAVDDMKMVIGERVIEAEIKKREEARKTYEDAKRKGHTAALLEQERPNIFTQSVANIAPSEDIDVVISYVQNLTYDSGEYEFVFPMVVGPRFIPGTPGKKSQGAGWAKDTDKVPDASRITPLLIGGGLRTGHDISLEMTVDPGFAVKSWNVPTHDVSVRQSDDSAMILRLNEKDSIPNRDFVLKYRVDGDEPQASFLSHVTEEGQGYFSLIVQPPRLNIERLVGKREIIFVVDVSGSMSGRPLSMCKEAMKEAILKLRPVDTFNVITFASRTGQLFKNARPSNDTNIKMAIEFVEGMRAGGGTLMGSGVKAALKPTVEQGRHRYVFFMTDGYVGNEKEILGNTRTLINAMEYRGQRAKVFSYGTGSSVNRHLLDGIAKAGKGLAVYVTTREDPAIGVNRFFGYIDHAVLKNVQIDFSDLDVEDVYPKQLPDLFASRPMVIHGKFNSPDPSTILIKGEMNEKELSLPVHVKFEDNDDNDVLAALWAREKIGYLEDDLAYHGQSDEIVELITQLGLDYRLVTQYTSFVAVDRSRTVTGDLKTIHQPVETPEGVDPYKSSGGVIVAREEAGRKARRRSIVDSLTGKGRGYGMGTVSPEEVFGEELDDVRDGVARAPETAGAAKAKKAKRPASSEKTGADSWSETRAKQEKPAASMPVPATAAATEAEAEAAEDKDFARAQQKEARVSSRVSFKITKVNGAIEKQSIMNSLNVHKSQIKYCYENALKTNPGLAGRVVLRFIIQKDGSIQTVTVARSALGDSAVENCIKIAAKRWKFDKPSDGGFVIVTVAVNLSPGG